MNWGMYCLGTVSYTHLNGVVNISDVMAACRILARAAGETPPTSAEILAADVNGSGTVDILDIMGICRILAGKKA